MNKKAQLTVWVIVALVLVASIILYFMVNRPGLTTPSEVFNPTIIIEKCAGEAVNDAVDKMLPQGGFLEPVHYKLYNGTKITYICEIPEYFQECINLHPMLLTEITAQLKDYSKPIIEKCFDSVKDEAAKRNIAVELGEMGLDISLTTGRILMNVTRETKITEKDSTRNFKDYNFEILTPIYDLANVANEIADGESTYCEFDYVEYMMTSKRFDIEKIILSDYTRLYFIEDKESGKVMKIAIRSCAFPAGTVKND